VPGGENIEQGVCAVNNRFPAYALAGAMLLASNAWSQVKVTAPWAWVTMPGQNSGAAYMRIESEHKAILLGADSPAAKTTGIHESKMDGEVMRMRAIPKLDLPAGKTVEFRPGGYHLMLTGLKQPLNKGDVVQIHLKFEASDKSVKTVEVLAEVRDAPPDAPAAKAGGMQGMKMR